jgi:GT2 family glycosyltransferase
MSPPQVIIIVLNWNGKNDTLACLHSLTVLSHDPSHALLVVDNGSEDGSVAAFREQFPELSILQTGANLGYAGGNNAGIRWALEKPFEWILLLNNDTVVASDLLVQFFTAIRENPKSKIFGTIGRLWDSSIGQYVDAPSPTSVDMVCGSTLLMHRSVPETIGLLEERYFLLWEEADFCARAKRAGFNITAVPAAHVLHKGSASFTGGKPHLQYFWWRNRLLWIARNCTPKETRKLYRSVVLPEMARWIKHTCFKTLCFRRTEQARRLRAGVRGMFDYFWGRFGNCPIAYTRRNKL